jgi:hypothetical protein
MQRILSEKKKKFTTPNVITGPSTVSLVSTMTCALDYGLKYIIFKSSPTIKIVRFSGSHSGGYEEFCLPGYSIM